MFSIHCRKNMQFSICKQWSSSNSVNSQRFHRSTGWCCQIHRNNHGASTQKLSLHIPQFTLCLIFVHLLISSQFHLREEVCVHPVAQVTITFHCSSLVSSMCWSLLITSTGVSHRHCLTLDPKHAVFLPVSGTDLEIPALHLSHIFLHCLQSIWIIHAQLERLTHKYHL